MPVFPRILAGFAVKRVFWSPAVGGHFLSNISTSLAVTSRGYHVHFRGGSLLQHPEASYGAAEYGSNVEEYFHIVPFNLLSCVALLALLAQLSKADARVACD